jgi:hypothetical protein
LLEPNNSDFSGDVHVLQRLLQREHEAHTALGDAASIMGKYDVAAEEELIRKALAGSVTFEEVVPTTEQALSGGDSIAAMLARIAQGETVGAADELPAVDAAETGLFASANDYLRDALTEVYESPGLSSAAGGVEWREDATHGTVQFVPKRDLVQRLAVLPQSYLSGRHVTEKLMIATTTQRAKAVLAEARDNPSSSTLWPEAHYLGPLHPVLDWVSDRALGKLGRNEIFAVTAAVESPTVLLIGTLTNRRGQVVASSFMTVEVPDPTSPGMGFVRVHANAQEALSSLGLLEQLVNANSVTDIGELQAMIAPAVASAKAQMIGVSTAAAENVHDRIDAWSTRVSDWQQGAAALAQLPGLQINRATVEQERAIAESMKPDQTLVRPLLVVVPPTTPESSNL